MLQGRDSDRRRGGAGAQHHDAVMYNNGVFSAARRVQPRLADAEKSKQFDQVVASRAERERDICQKKKHVRGSDKCDSTANRCRVSVARDECG